MPFALCELALRAELMCPCRRRSTIDCEHVTLDEEVIEACRSELPTDLVLQYLVHGEFKNDRGKPSVLP